MSNYTEIEISDLTPAFLRGEKGEAGTDGKDGLSAYEVAVQNGFAGTEEQWLESLKGEEGVSGMVGFELRNGYLYAISENSESINKFKIKDGHMIVTI